MNISSEDRPSKYLSFYFFIMYLYTAMPAIQFSMIENANLIFLVFGYGLTLLTAYKLKINLLNKRFLLVISIIIIWSCVQLILHRSYFRLSPFIILETLTAFVVVKAYSGTIYRRFENITYYLCIVALIGWILNIALHPAMMFLANRIGIKASGDLSSSLIFYTVNMTDGYRNCGFCWEPGRFACLTCIGLLFYLLRTKCKFKTTRFLIFTIAIISTFSTTGFSVYLVVMCLCYLSFHKINFIHLSLLSILVIGTFSLPFMGDKIDDLLGQAGNDAINNMAEQLTWNSENKADRDREFYVPQRFEGLMFSVMNVVNSNYIIGDGRDFQYFYINRILDWKVKTSEGVLEIIVRYGILIGFLCYYYLYKTSKIVSKHFRVNNKWVYFITFILINISYNFWEVPLFMAIWMMPIYLSCRKPSIKSSEKYPLRYNHNPII